MIHDSHIHIDEPVNIRDTAAFFTERIRKYSLSSITVVPYSVWRDKLLLDNLAALGIKKLMNGKAYAYTSLIHAPYADESAQGLRDQLIRSLRMGADGLKILEGKPGYRAKLGKRLDDPVFDLMYAYAEENAVPILMHTGDPANFWTDRTYERFGWYYGGREDVPSYEALYDEVEGILKKFPRLRITMAHFFFLSESFAYASKLFDTYPNLGFDLTPGGEMYDGFSKDIPAARAFFTRYADRLYFGTDGTNDPSSDPTYQDIQNLVNTALDGTGTAELWGHTSHPLGLAEDVCRKIRKENYLREHPTPAPLCGRAIIEELDRIISLDPPFNDVQKENNTILRELFG